MMSLWDALRMNMMISYQELVRTFLRRFVIKCRVDNPQSNQVALRNGFILEGCLKQAEFLNDAYDDVNLYARIIDSQ